MDFKASSNKANEVEMLYSSFFHFAGRKYLLRAGWTCAQQVDVDIEFMILSLSD